MATFTELVRSFTSFKLSSGNPSVAVDQMIITGTANIANANVLTVTNGAQSRATTAVIPNTNVATTYFTMSSSANGSPILSSATITASTTHTAVAATRITTAVTNVIVNNASDSIMLPQAVAGLVIHIYNSSLANSCSIFPFGTDAIAAGAPGDTSLAAASTFYIFVCFVAGTWQAI